MDFARNQHQKYTKQLPFYDEQKLFSRKTKVYTTMALVSALFVVFFTNIN